MQFAAVDAGWWDFSAAGAGYMYHDKDVANQSYEMTPVANTFTAIALIELPTLLSNAAGYAVMGRQNTAPAVTDEWAIYHGVNVGPGFTNNLRARVTNGSGTEIIDLPDPILPNVKTLVALRFQYVGVGNVNILKISCIDHRGISTSTVNNIGYPAGTSVPGMWLAGRAGLNNLAGKMYYAAVYTGSYGVASAPLSDLDLLSIYSSIAHPANVAGLKFYTDFHQAVSSTYLPEVTNPVPQVGYGTTWKPHTFTVANVPVKGGSTVQTTYSSPHSGYIDTSTGTNRLVITSASDPSCDDFYPVAKNFSVAALVKREILTVPDQWSLLLKCENMWSFEVFPGGGGLGDIAFWVSNGGTVTLNASYNVPNNFTDNTGISLLTGSYTYVSPANNNVVKINRIDKATVAGATSVTQNNFPPIALPALPANRIATIGRSMGRPGNPGYLYWIAFWDHGSDPVWTDADFKDMFKQLKHPVNDFKTGLKTYIDFHKQPIGTTYRADFGEYTFTVEGTVTPVGNNGITIPERPTVSTASAPLQNTVLVTFSETMVVNAAYTNPANYTITGPSTVAVLSVSAVSATQVQLVVSPDLDSLGSYTVTASNVTSVYGHPLDTLSDSYTFYAPLVAPIVAPFVTKTAYAKQPGMSLEFLPDCGFVMVDDETALQDNIRTLMSLHKGEVLLDHDLGNPLYASLFDQNDVALWLTLDTAVRTTVNTYEPRVDIKRVVVSKDAQTGDVVNMQVDWISKQSKVSTSTQVDMPYGDSL